MQISREYIKRLMEGGRGGNSVAGTNVGGASIAQMESLLTNYATQPWVENGYLSKAFFNELFTIHAKKTVVENAGTEEETTTTTDITVSPNDWPVNGGGITYQITGIELKYGAWTNSYMSALGQNGVVSGGGGGGGGSVTSVGLSMPTGFNVTHTPVTGADTLTVAFSEGYSLPAIAKQTQWDTAYTNNHTHANKSILDSITQGKLTNWDAAYTFAAGSGFGTEGTDYVPITIGSTTKNVLTDHQSLAGYATQQWVGQQGFLKSVSFSDLTSHPSTLSGYGITDAVGSSTTWWGRSISNGAVGGHIDFAKGDNIRVISGSSYLNLFGISATSGDNTLLLGWGIKDDSSYPVTITSGGVISMGYGNNTSDTYGKWWSVFRNTGHVTINALDIEDTSSITRNIFLNVGGNVKTNRLYLYTGSTASDDVYLYYDSTNKGVKVVGAGLYTDSFLSALGLNPSISSASSLSELSDVLLSSPSAGQVLTYRNGKWKNETPSAGASSWNDITGKPTTIAGYGITDAKIQNGTITLGSNTITPLTSVDSVPRLSQTTISESTGSLSDFKHATDLIYSAAGGSNTVADKPTGVTAFGVVSMKIAIGYWGQVLIGTDGGMYYRTGSAFSGGWKTLATTDSNVASATYATSAGSATTATTATSATTATTATSAGKLTNSVNLWGNSFNGTADLMNTLTIANGQGINIKNTSGTAVQLVAFNSSSTSEFLLGDSTGTYNTYLRGKNIYFKYGANVTGMTLDNSGDVTLANNLKMSQGKYLKVDINGTYREILGLWGDSYNLVQLGYNSALSESYATNIYGYNLRFFGNASHSNPDMLINTDGNVGIGTTSPLYKLHVSGIGYFQNNVGIGAYPSSSQDANVYKLRVGGESYFNGNVGIYTNPGDFDLNVDGYIKANRLYLSNSVYLYYDSTNRGIKIVGAGLYTDYFLSALGMSTASIQYLPLSGGVLTGNFYQKNSTLIRGTAPSSRIVMAHGWQDKNSNPVGWYEFLADTNGTNSIGIYVLGNVAYTNSTSNKYGGITITKARNNSGNYSAVFNANTGVFTAVSFTNSSDIRMKCKMEDVEIRIKDIADAPIFRFMWNDGADNMVHVGTSAQHWLKMLPWAVTTDRDGMYGLDYGATALAAAVMTARKVVDHETRIAALEKENEQLRKELETLKAA